MDIHELTKMQIMGMLKAELSNHAQSDKLSVAEKTELLEDFEQMVDYIYNNPANIESKIMLGLASNSEIKRFLALIDQKNH